MTTATDLETWKHVAASPDLLEAAAATDPTRVASVTRLRQHHPATHVAAALLLTQARCKAQVKFPNDASRLLADPSGVEQASSMAVAHYKAQRFKKAGILCVADLCCGIGGDAMALTRLGLEVLAVDRDPLRAWMTAQNAGCESRVADVQDLLTDQAPWLTPASGPWALHLDPARRNDAGRRLKLADYLPPPATVCRLLESHPDATVKLSPAVDLDELATALPPGELEFISEAGHLVQALLHTGRLQAHAINGKPPHTATLLTGQAVHTLCGQAQAPERLPLSKPLQYLFTVDPAVERAQLIHLLGLPALHPRLGLLTANELPPSPWLTAFELIETLPLRPKKLKAWLSRHDAGLIEVKTRGKAVDPDLLQTQLRGHGKTPYTLFAMRFDQRRVVFITRRLTS